MKNEIRVVKGKIGDVTPAPINANKGSERGRYALEESFRKFGAGASLVTDKNNKLIVGEQRHEVAGAIGIEDLIIVDSDGTKLVAVRRIDLDVNDPHTMEMAIADNRVGQLSLEWDAEQMQHCLDLGVNVDAYFRPDELELTLIRSDDDGFHDEPPPVERTAKTTPDDKEKFALAVVLDWSNHQRWQRLKEEFGKKKDTDAFLAMMDALEAGV